METGNNRSVHFTHLAPGTYTLFVEASNGEGGWQGLEKPIKIIIHPPWWHSKLAYIVYTLLGLWGLWEIYKFQLKRIKIKQQLAFDQREIERVRALEQMKTDFFANVTHEFRTPLTLIQEPIRQLMQHPNDPQLSEKLRLIERNSRRLLGLVNQLLDMAKLESGHMQLDLRMGNLGETVRSVFQSFMVLAAQKNIQLHLDIEPSMPFMVFDAPKIELILNNLLSNALKFTPENGKVSLTCRLEDHTDKKKILIQVTDNGPGIAAKDIPLVFDRFYQVDASGGGTGIGLALSQELAMLMNGRITVQSSLGEGAIFTLRLPVNLSMDSTAASNIEPLSQVVPSPEKQKMEEHELPIVLIIEDNIELRHFIGQSIGSNWQIIEASNGDEGIQKAQEMVPDLVVSDLMMPGKDGYAVCAALKSGEMTAHIPIILLTARSGIESKLMGLRQGADDYLTKPFNAEELKARMENLIASRRQLLDMRQNRQKGKSSADFLSESQLMEADKVFLRRFQLILEECLSDSQMGVEEFARKMFISRVQLHRKMKAITNKNAGDYIRDFRLERAMEMLKNREGLVVEIADRVGFVNEKYFSTVFKEKYGISPSQVN